MAKVITYDPAFNRIYAKGGTEIDPISCNDLWIADQANGWGVVHSYGQNTYHLDALLYLGDGTTSTYFIDSDKIIVFTDQITGQPFLINVYSNAHIQLGECNDEDAKETYNGCVIKSEIDGLFPKLFGGGSTNTYRRLYGCTVITPNLYNKYCRIYSYDNTRLWNCNLINYVWPELAQGSPDIYNCTMMSGTDTIRAYGFSGQAGSPIINDCIGLHLRRLADCRPYNWDIRINKFKALQNEQAVAIQYQHNKDVILVDCELTNWINLMRGETQPGKILRKYSVNMHLADKDGNNLEAVNVICKDKNGNEVFNVNTAADGSISTQEVTYQEWYQLSYDWHGEEDATTFSPHTFEISKENYEPLKINNITLNEPIDWHLELLPYLAESDVKKDVQFGEGKIGTYVGGMILSGQNLEGVLEAKKDMEGQLSKKDEVTGVLSPKKDEISGQLEKGQMTGELSKSDEMTGEKE